MGIEEDVSKLLKGEGYRINETIRDAIVDFLGIVKEENEEMEEDLEGDREEEEKKEDD